jgi:hypothetical protein
MVLLAAGCGGTGPDDTGSPARRPGDPVSARPDTTDREQPDTTDREQPDTTDREQRDTAGPDTVTAPADDDAARWTHGVVDVRRTGMPVVVAAIRAARHPGFDRIVVEFQGDSVPGYRISYIDRPVRQCASGSVVPIRGEAWLEIRLRPAQAHDDAGKPTMAGSSLETGLSGLKQLVRTCDFEGDVTWVGGLLSPNDFRVTELRRPGRLVIDVREN